MTHETRGGRGRERKDVVRDVHNRRPFVAPWYGHPTSGRYQPPLPGLETREFTAGDHRGSAVGQRGARVAAVAALLMGPDGTFSKAGIALLSIAPSTRSTFGAEPVMLWFKTRALTRARSDQDRVRAAHALASKDAGIEFLAGVAWGVGVRVARAAKLLATTAPPKRLRQDSAPPDIRPRLATCPTSPRHATAFPRR